MTSLHDPRGAQLSSSICPPRYLTHLAMHVDAGGAGPGAEGCDLVRQHLARPTFLPPPPPPARGSWEPGSGPTGQAGVIAHARAWSDGAS